MKHVKYVKHDESETNYQLSHVAGISPCNVPVYQILQLFSFFLYLCRKHLNISIQRKLCYTTHKIKKTLLFFRNL